MEWGIRLTFVMAYKCPASGAKTARDIQTAGVAWQCTWDLDHIFFGGHLRQYVDW